MTWIYESRDNWTSSVVSWLSWWSDADDTFTMRQFLIIPLTLISLVNSNKKSNGQLNSHRQLFNENGDMKMKNGR